MYKSTASDLQHSPSIHNYYNHFRTSTVFARVTKVIPWILAKIQRGECGFIHDQFSKRRSAMNYLDRKETRELRKTFFKEREKEKQRGHRGDRGDRTLKNKKNKKNIDNFRLCC